MKGNCTGCVLSHKLQLSLTKGDDGVEVVSFHKSHVVSPPLVDQEKCRLSLDNWRDMRNHEKSPHF